MRNFMVCVAVAVSLSVGMDAAAAVKICRAFGTDVYADNTGAVAASAQFQYCISDPTVTVMNLEPGTYLVDAPIVTERPITIRTAGLSLDNRNCQQLGAGRCAVFLASADPYACINNAGHCTGLPANSGGMLQSRNTTGVRFDHLVLDGNRANRQNTSAKGVCAAGPQTPGYNGRMAGCTASSSADRCEFTYSFTRNALCGTGFEFSGNYGRIQGNAAYNNGADANGLRADGLSVVSNHNGIVNDNHPVNNTHYGLMVGSARNAQIQSNWIQQTTVFAIAGLQLGAYCAGQPYCSDFTNTNIRYNTIQISSFNASFGINLGIDPFESADYANTSGGLVTQNTISGARVLINFGGAGAAGNRTTVTNNTLSGQPTVAMPLKPGWPCWAAANVQQNLPNNNTYGICGNFANADPIATSNICFLDCLP